LGYTLEARVPFETIRPGLKAPKAGVVWPSHWNIHWSDAEGKIAHAQLIEIVNPQSSSEDDTLIRMMKALQALRGIRHEVVPLSLVGLNAEEDFQWLPSTWRKLVISERADGQVVAILQVVEYTLLLIHCLTPSNSW
jgi:hypothetical protein